MKQLSVFFTLLFCSLLHAQKKEINIRQYGAKPDGITNNTAAIQKAINDVNAAGGGKVVVPKGRYVTGVIEIKSNVELHVEAEGFLLAIFNRADYGPSLKASALIIGNHQRHIAITGRGVIDGQCDLLIDDMYKNYGQESCMMMNGKILTPGIREDQAKKQTTYY